MVGSSWLVNKHWSDLVRNCLAYINVDSPGMKGTSRYGAASSTELARFHQALEREVLGEETRRRRLTHVGDQSFMGIGIPALSGRTDYDPKLIESWHGANLAPWHHSDEMTLDKMDIEVMLKSMRVYVAYLVRFCNIAVIPYDHLAVAKELKDRLEVIASSVGGKMDLSVARRHAGELVKKTEALDGNLQALRKETERMSSWKGNSKVLLANRLQMKLSRILHPINFSVSNRYGFDHYGLTALSTPIPCLYETRNLASLFPSSTEYQALLTHLVQQANRVSDGLRDAAELIEAALEQWKRI